MNDYAPESSLGWLDFDAAASERVSTLLRSLEEPSTLDVLGLGSIRDAFADMLSPGTSTVQTRLRYFIFLPWIFQRLDAEQVPAANFASELRNAEASLIYCFRRGEEGVIGSRAGRNLRRMPSDIYWGSMRAWDVRRLDMSIAQYAQRRQRRTDSARQHDDDGNATEPAASMWAAIPAPPENFPFQSSEITFELEPDEAQVLTEGIRRRHPDSLVTVLSTMPDQTVDVDFPWQLPTGRLPHRLVEVLRHARCFSELALGPGLIYNVLLAREAGTELGWDTEQLEDDQLARLDEWHHLVNRRLAELRTWVVGLPEFWQLLSGYRIHPTTRHFWTDMVQRAVDDPPRFAEDREVHRRIRGRERQLKSKRARLSHRSALEHWNQQPFGGQLDYRWPIAKQYIKDLGAA